MKHLIIICLFFLIINYQTNAQKLEYNILIGDKIIGSLIAELSESNDTAKYTIHTDAKVSLLFSFELKHLIKTTFINNELSYAFTRNIINDHEKEQTETTMNIQGGKFYIDNEVKSQVTEPIHYSVAQLYHKIPINIDKVYSERFGKFLKLFNKEERQNELIMPDGKKNLYYYGTDNLCQKVIVEQTFTDLTIIRKR